MLVLEARFGFPCDNDARELEIKLEGFIRVEGDDKEKVIKMRRRVCLFNREAAWDESLKVDGKYDGARRRILVHDEP